MSSKLSELLFQSGTFPLHRMARSQLALLATLVISPFAQADLQFSEVGAAAGVRYAHRVIGDVGDYDDAEAGGVAAGDFNNDGLTDLYLDRGDFYANVLLKNMGDGTFTDVTSGSGVAMAGIFSSGPVFADINGDGWQDLLVGGMKGAGYHVFLNDQDGTFTDASLASGITKQHATQNDISSGLGDVDHDGDLDLFVGHHKFDTNVLKNHLWINNGTGVFTAADATRGTGVFLTRDMSFSATFIDINKDGWQDLLVTADSGQTKLLSNDQDGTFTDRTGSWITISDQFGMGSAPADYDNDGDIDWFVTSIHYNPDGETSSATGNRYYRNNGSGTFTETSSSAGVRLGYWGWGACAADFDNDGWLDIFHVNGMFEVGTTNSDFLADPSRLFLNDHDGTFTESSAAASLADTGQGRGLVCFDYDVDGDIDIFVFNNNDISRLYKNNLTDNPGWLQVDVVPEEAGKTVAGTVIEVITGANTQTRHITVGNNHMSQNPLRQHFGLGGAALVDQVKVTWPSGNQEVLNNQAINQRLTVVKDPPEPPVFEDGFED